jgi:hypothetical protein
VPDNPSRSGPPPPGSPEHLSKTDPRPRARGAPAAPPEPSIDLRAVVAARNARVALLVFNVLTAAALIAWFATQDQPWGFSSFVALLAALLGAGATFLFWRRPTRDHAIAGAAVILFSLVRLGAPGGWTFASAVVILVTGLLATPVVQAAFLLPRS